MASSFDWEEGKKKGGRPTAIARSLAHKKNNFRPLSKKKKKKLEVEDE